MTKARYEELMGDQGLMLTDDEIKEGWHFCGDWDGLLIDDGSPESDCCHCQR